MKYMHMISRERGHSKGQGVGMKGRLELSRKFFCFGTVTRPLDCYDHRRRQKTDEFPEHLKGGSGGGGLRSAFFKV